MLCGACNEPVPHLFFSCAYSQTIWHQIQKLLNHSKLYFQFDKVIQEVAKAGRKTADRSKLLCRCFTEAIYVIWMQRNSHVFNGTHKITDAAFKEIISRVAYRCNESQRLKLIM